MNSPTCITRSRRAIALPLAAALLAGCGGSQPDPKRAIDPALPMAQPPQAAEAEKGQGSISFHYANKSTDADLAIDLSSTDVYLEMTGKAAEEQIEQLRQAAPGKKPEPAAPARKPAAAAPADDAPEGSAAEADKGEARPPEGREAARGPRKNPSQKPEPPPEEGPADYEDVTSKVLAGIRRAQELFYQKRYPEAMQAARSSLDARPTAEGYALLGSIYFMQNQPGMARRQWLEALRLNPDMPAVVNMLERTRTPGGRGSPSPRPVYHPPAPAPEAEAPYPEEASVPAPAPVPAAAATAPMAPSAPPAAPQAAPDGEGDEEADGEPAPAVPAKATAPQAAAKPANPAPAAAAAPAKAEEKRKPAPAPAASGKPAKEEKR